MGDIERACSFLSRPYVIGRGRAWYFSLTRFLTGCCVSCRLSSQSSCRSQLVVDVRRRVREGRPGQSPARIGRALRLGSTFGVSDPFLNSFTLRSPAAYTTITLVAFQKVPALRNIQFSSGGQVLLATRSALCVLVLYQTNALS